MIDKPLQPVDTEGAVPQHVVSANPSRFKNRSEAEFAGYCGAQDYLQHDAAGPLNVGLILHLHRLLYSFVDGAGGRFKLDDNLVVDRNTDGTTTVRFEPVPAAHTENYMFELVARTNAALDGRRRHAGAYVGRRSSRWSR